MVLFGRLFFGWYFTATEFGEVSKIAASEDFLVSILDQTTTYFQVRKCEFQVG